MAAAVLRDLHSSAGVYCWGKALPFSTPQPCLPGCSMRGRIFTIASGFFHLHLYPGQRFSVGTCWCLFQASVPTASSFLLAVTYFCLHQHSISFSM